MGTTLHTLAPNRGATKTKKRLGRGRGSGTGKTSGKGVKGQKARPGHHGAKLGYEGGQVPMVRRIPKRGFTNLVRHEVFPVNLSALEEAFEAGATVDLDVLRAKGLLPKKATRVKVLANGELTKKLTISAHAFSASAKEKLAKVGCSINEVEA